MTPSIRSLTAAGALIVAAGAMPAAAELPSSVRALLDAAIANGNDAEIATVAKFAKATNPADAEEIDTLIAAHKQQIAAAEEARKREAGFFENWHGSGELGGFLSTGNSKTSGVSVGITLTREGINWRHKLRAIVDYQRADDITTRNQWMGSYEPNYNLNKDLYVFGLGIYEKDRFQGFADRITASGGLGFHAVNNDAMTLDLKAGPAWRRTNWIEIPDTSDFSGLAGADFVWHISPSFDVSDNAQALVGSDNSTYSNTASLTAKFNSALSARLSFGVRHETNPPPDAKSTDTVTRATLVYGF